MSFQEWIPIFIAVIEKGLFKISNLRLILANYNFQCKAQTKILMI